jgi:drug/metabolite transporter (DMT)-like permease
VKSGPLLATLVTVLSISAGQVLFKIAAGRANAANSMLALDVLGILLVAVTLYGGATLIWVYVLRQVPLSAAYVFMSLSFIIVPLLGWLLFKESLTARYFMGMALIVAGILLSLSARTG